MSLWFEMAIYIEMVMITLFPNANKGEQVFGMFLCFNIIFFLFKIKCVNQNY